MEQETQDHGLQRAIDITSRRDRSLDFLPVAREDARREGIQGDRGRGYHEGGRRRIRRQRLPGNWTGYAEEEAERRRTHPLRQGIQLADLIIPRTCRAARCPFQELEDLPHRLPAPILYLP